MTTDPNTCCTDQIEALLAEIETYLRVVDVFRAAGSCPTWAEDESLRWGWAGEPRADRRPGGASAAG